ncbi:delta(3,5)-Delta(2,4)-dienoyl-CoA isomerase, mitochondrial-like isoform X2 [Hydractinia symbiolongicarpus]|nr:delta(3,5)-Delta(2,4)-dienoyl-CoA isomerase, mitochondrial-like isoform X2 [Hydractinia symbiolongicarpus]
MSDISAFQFETLRVSNPVDHVLHVEINRPGKRNAMNPQFFKDMQACFKKITDDPHSRCIVLSGSGKHFTSGLDIMEFMPMLMTESDEDVGRRSFQLRRLISELQESFTVIEKCPKPVIAAMHSACIGGGVDLACSCDMRLCTYDSWFEIKEIDLALAADIGTLQRLPKIIGNHSLVRELAYTARKLFSDEALTAGFVSRVYNDKKTMIHRAVELAVEISSKSPVAIGATKLQLNYARDHTVDEGLDYICSWNMGLLQSKDLLIAGQSSLQKQTPKFEDMKSKL